MRIDESGDNNHVVTADQVKWLEWKQLLDNWFKVPSSLRIKSNYVYQFKNCLSRSHVRYKPVH